MRRMHRRGLRLGCVASPPGLQWAAVDNGSDIATWEAVGCRGRWAWARHVGSVGTVGTKCGRLAYTSPPKLCLQSFKMSRELDGHTCHADMQIQVLRTRINI